MNQRRPPLPPSFHAARRVVAATLGVCLLAGGFLLIAASARPSTAAVSESEERSLSPRLESGESELEAVIDRIEVGLDGEKVATLLLGDEEAERRVPAAALPVGAQPGSWLRVTLVDGAIHQIELDEERTRQTRAAIEEKARLLRERATAP